MADQLSETFGALADPTRRAILARLASGEASVTELAAPFEMSMPAISKHLKVLERAGLIARGTVNTMPGATLEAFADHGEVTGDTVTGGYPASRQVLDQLAAAAVDFDDVTEYLERDGLAKFEKSWSELGATVAAELEEQRSHPGNSRP